MDEASVTFPIELDRSELALVRTALEMLEDTLGHEEADELEEVQALLRRLPEAPED
jgi:hypothetical protein